MTLFVGVALDPTVFTNQFIEVFKSRAVSKNVCWTVKLHINFFFQTISDGDMTKTKVIDLEKL